MRRGLTGVRAIISDDHAGLRAARRAVFPSVLWQRCQFHLQQNAQSPVSRLDQRASLAQGIRQVFNAADLAAAQVQLKSLIAQYAKASPKLADWLEQAIPEGLAVFDLPAAHRVRLRTTNGLERLNKEIKRRTRVAALFPNPESLLHLVTAILGEIDDGWATAAIYLNTNSQP